jgi:hypothetical protein
LQQFTWRGSRRLLSVEDWMQAGCSQCKIHRVVDLELTLREEMLFQSSESKYQRQGPC